MKPEKSDDPFVVAEPRLVLLQEYLTADAVGPCLEGRIELFSAAPLEGQEEGQGTPGGPVIPLGAHVTAHAGDRDAELGAEARPVGHPPMDGKDPPLFVHDGELQTQMLRAADVFEKFRRRVHALRLEQELRQGVVKGLFPEYLLFLPGAAEGFRRLPR